MQHSKLGASSTARWLNCPGSVPLSETVPKQPSSSYALEGTAAHKLGEICIHASLGKNHSPYKYVGEDIYLDDKSKYTVDQDMADAVGIYVNYVAERAKLGKLFIETKFDLSFVHKGMFGTNDACIYSETLGMLEVIDYKHGAGIAVKPEENTQLAYYGLGAAKKHNLHPDSQIILTVVQPRVAGDAIKSWTTTVEYLETFGKTLRKGALATEHKNPKFVEGDWCRFCPAQAVCPQLEKKALEVAKAEFSGEAIILPDPNSLKKTDIEKVLGFSKVMSSWLKSVEAFAFNELESGRSIDGYKLVKKRANRKWINADFRTQCDIQDELGQGDEEPPEEWFTTPKLKSPAQLEKLVDKDLVASLCESPDNGNTMVPVSDKRPEVLSTIASEFDLISE